MSDCKTELQSIADNPLAYAIMNGDFEDACNLINNKDLDVNVNRQGCLYFACHEDQFDIVRELLKHSNINVNFPHICKGTPLVYAVNENSIGSVRELLKHPNIDVNTEEPFGRTPLYMASCKGRDRVVRELLRNDNITRWNMMTFEK